ncbi:MAG: hypothetical protein Q9191_006869, partial [Dirinaria sp. TL-2023a]
FRLQIFLLLLLKIRYPQETFPFQYLEVVMTESNAPKTDPSSHCSLEPFHIPSLPRSAYYISSFLTAAEETDLLSHINSQPQPTWRYLSHRRLQAHPSVLSKSNTLLDQPLPKWLREPIVNRILELRCFRATEDAAAPAAGGEIEGGGEEGEGERVFEKSPHGAPNHVLINEYTPGQGIFPHEDGDAYHPVVCTVSLGSSIVYNVHPKSASGQIEQKPRWRLLQEPRSLLITMGEMYKGCLHSIESVKVDEDLVRGDGGVGNWDLLREETKMAVEAEGGRSMRETRLSLTFRDVIRVKKLGKGLALLGR